MVKSMTRKNTKILFSFFLASVISLVVAISAFPHLSEAYREGKGAFPLAPVLWVTISMLIFILLIIKLIGSGVEKDKNNDAGKIRQRQRRMKP